MTVFIPKYEKLGFRVVRAAASEPSTRPSELVEVKSRKLKRPSLAYDFANPVKLRPWWNDVAPAQSGSSEGLMVGPGRYRFTVYVSASDPTQSEADTVSLCKAYSDAFVVSEPSHSLRLQ